MRAINAALSEIERRQVMRVALSPTGLAELSAAGGYGDPVSAELMDAEGEICGRATRQHDPGANRYGTGLLWRVQLGGVLASRVWAAQPMGCGSSDNPHDACRAAMADLRNQAQRRLACAALLSDIFNR